MICHKLPGSILLSSVIAVSTVSTTAYGVEVYAGTGIGFSNRSSQWVANIVFSGADKKRLKGGVTASFHTGQDLTPACAADSNPNCPMNQLGMTALLVPPTNSTAWCDPEADPPRASTNTYNVIATFDEPAYNSIAVPRDTVFKGSFDWDIATKKLKTMRGTMNQVMVSSDQTLNLTHLLAWSYDETSNSVTASVFRNDSTAIYTSGAYDRVPTSPETDGTSNAYFTLNFNASDPTSVTTSNIDKLIYGDCVGKSVMGTLCMTGLVPEGTMSGYPQSLNIASASPPSGSSGGETTHCYGSAFASKWVIVDLNGLKKAGVRNAWVTVTASRYDDGVPMETDGAGNSLASDDDLIPALTVFRGRQDVGAHGFWYPNQFQGNPPFWAWKLSPFYATPNASDTSGGWATANGALTNNSVSVVGKYVLTPGNQNYLTIAVGGDARDSSARHDVNFKLDVTVSLKQPTRNVAY